MLRISISLVITKEKSASLMPSQTVVADYVFTWNNKTLKLIFDWYFNSWGYIPSIFDHLPCFYKRFKYWLCDTRINIEDKGKKINVWFRWVYWHFTQWIFIRIHISWTNARLKMEIKQNWSSKVHSHLMRTLWLQLNELNYLFGNLARNRRLSIIFVWKRTIKPKPTRTHKKSIYSFIA